MAFEAAGEVDDFRFRRRVDQLGLAPGQRCGHHQILGRTDRYLREYNFGASEPARRAGMDIAAVQVDLGPHLLQPMAVQIDRPRTDGAAAGQRNLGFAAARQQRTQHEDAGPHLADKVIGRGCVGNLPRRQLQHVAAMRVIDPRADADLHAHRAQQIGHGGDVGQMRHVRQRQRLVGQDAGGHDRQGRVLGAADRNDA